MNDKHDDLRAEFEAWADGQGLNLERRHGAYCAYYWLSTHDSWTAWQAAYSAGQRVAALRAARVCQERAANHASETRENEADDCASAILCDAGIE